MNPLSTTRADISVKSRISRLTAWMLALAAVITLTPLLIFPQTLLYYDVTPKVAVLLLGTAAALIFASQPVSALYPELRLLRILVCLQILSLLISTYFSSEPLLS